MWTHFHDMHSGGNQKHKAPHIYIEAPEAEARIIFYNRFGTNPDRVTCTCCGPDYSITESPTLDEATAFNRSCSWAENGYIEEAGPTSWGEYKTLEAYLETPDCLVVRADDITPDERIGSIPEQGYVWI